MFQDAPRWSPPKRGLYMMGKLPPERLSEVAALPRISQRRPPELLHTTLMAFVDLAEWPEEFLPDLLERMEGFQAHAFYVYFDHIAEGKVVALRSHKPQRGVKSFRKQLADFLVERDFPYFVVPGEPHVTIRYGRDGKGNEPIAPISWRVDEVLLIESLGGKSTHIERGRWALHPLLI